MKWVYKIETMPVGLADYQQEDTLNNYGEYGWELVAIDSGRYIFKMPDTICKKCGEQDCNDPIACEKIEQSDLASAKMNEEMYEMYSICLYCGDPNCYEVRTPEDVRALDKEILLPLCVDTYREMNEDSYE